METTVKEEKKNPLLKRTEVSAEISFEGATPKRADVQKNLAEKFKVAADAVTVLSIATRFGSPVALVRANVYASAEDRNAFERKAMLSKGAPKKDAPAAQ